MACQSFGKSLKSFAPFSMKCRNTKKTRILEEGINSEETKERGYYSAIIRVEYYCYLSIKPFCRVILNRFSLRKIVEQFVERNAVLFANLVDVRKAFDSLYRDTLWAVMRHYGLPQKIVSLIKLL